MADEVVARIGALKKISGVDMPTLTLREVLGGLVERINADTRTKHVEVVLALPSWAFGHTRQKTLIMVAPQSVNGHGRNRPAGLRRIKCACCLGLAATQPANGADDAEVPTRRIGSASPCCARLLGLISHLTDQSCSAGSEPP